MNLQQQPYSQVSLSALSFSPLTNFLNAIHPLNEEARRYVEQNTYPVQFEKGEFLVMPGIINDRIYFLVKGVVRGYINEDGRDITTWICEEGQMVGSIRNFGLDIPTQEHVQALEKCKLVAIPNAMIADAYDRFPEANIIVRKILEKNYRDAEERAYISRIPSAEKKYRRFEATRGQLINRIPLKYIASYLGITLETLSRIRSKK